ncbi:MAG: hypothetical protein J6T28_12920 [Paludibacteraceae bacterium]|nr:hypothetical protein [Paludibacteraceae bacterium]
MDKRERVLLDIQEEVLQGGISVQDWTTFQLMNAYISYCAGATLSCIIMCQTTIESYMRDDEQLSDRSFHDLIENCSYNQEMKRKLHKLRKYRNNWTHINEQGNEFLIDENELEEMALFSYRLALEVFHYYPFK